MVEVTGLEPAASASRIAIYRCFLMIFATYSGFCYEKLSSLSICIFIVAYLLVPKIKKCVKRDYILFGVMWFVLTNLFDLSAYIKSGEGFGGLLQSYNIFTGNTWLLVVLSALLSPMLVMKIKEKE